MKLTTIREIYKNREAYLDKEVTVGGWVRSVRDSKTFGFIVLHDGSYFETLQIVYHDEMENFAEISKMNVGAAIPYQKLKRAFGYSVCSRSGKRDAGADQWPWNRTRRTGRHGNSTLC